MQQLEPVIKKILSCYPDLKGIYLYGSFGTSYERPESDVDLAVLLAEPANTVELWDLAQELAIMLNRDVDLIDLIAVTSTIFRHQIVTTGQRIFCQNEFNFHNCPFHSIKSREGDVRISTFSLICRLRWLVASATTSDVNVTSGICVGTSGST